jgi:hypothetical protein
MQQITRNIAIYYGSSSETKEVSNVPVGSIWNETNTGDKYEFDGTSWFKHNLKVEAGLVVQDLQIGAVEIKNPTTDDRMKVNTNGSVDVNIKNITDGNNMLTINADGSIATVAKAGTAFIGRSGALAFKAITNFTRPANTSIYAEDDAITNVVTAAIAVAFTDAGDIVTLNGHGLKNGTVVSFATVVTTTGISTSTNYFVISSTTNTFQVSATFGGAALPLTTNGTGTMNACVLCIDLSTFGAVAGQSYSISNARVVSSVKGSASDLNVNIWIFNSVFTSTLDNAALDIDDTTAQTGGVVIPCVNAYRNASNHRCVSDCGAWAGQLAAADTKLYFILQAANAYTPASSEVLTIVFEGMLL